jgi:thymidylate kinase
MTTATATLAPTSARPQLPARPIRPTRGDILDALDVELTAIAQTPGIRAAWQGATGAKDAWRTATGPADLDIWCDDAGFAVLDATLSRFHGARIQQSDRPGRLRHVSYAIETLQGLAVVDLTRGDLMVGPVLLVPARYVQTAGAAAADGGPQLAGVAGAADRFVRPLLRGRIVDGQRLDQARDEWSRAERGSRTAFLASLRAQLGRRLARGIELVLDGDDAPSTLARDARRALVAKSLRPSSLAATWSSRHTVLPAGSRAGVLGLRTTGCLVVLVGTDGSGKSTVASEIDARLTSAGLRTSTAYLGMARGNLPGVSLARKLLGVAPAGDGAPTKPETMAPTASGSLDHSTVRRVAAWYYAAEYLLRWARDIRPGLRNGGVVIADRYVYDLRESPWPGSAASRVAEFLMPRPDVLVLPDAPDRIIHARKPERTAEEQAAQQERFRELVRSAPARTESLTVDTSGLSFELDPVAPVVSAVVASLHRKH